MYNKVVGGANIASKLNEEHSEAGRGVNALFQYWTEKRIIL